MALVIRNAVQNGIKQENAFVAVNEIDDELGWCRVEPRMNDQLMPQRPLEIRISAGGEETAQRQLWAAATARAMVIAAERGKGRSRIYAECPVDDERIPGLLSELGFRDGETVVRMRRKVESGPASVPRPEGCVPIIDELQDPDEKRFFLDREKELFRRDDAEEWLNALREKPLFARMLLTARSGLAGEAIVWADKTSRTGIIGQIYTVPAWRRRGVATYLLEMARRYFDGHTLPDEYTVLTRFSPDRPDGGSLKEIVADVRTRMTPVINLMTGAGYRRGETILRLPGMDL